MMLSPDKPSWSPGNAFAAESAFRPRILVRPGKSDDEVTRV
jgi:hypothetical protein